VNENTFKLLIGIFLLFFVMNIVCNNQKKQTPTYGDINVTTMVTAADGLDLKAVGELVKEVPDAESFERKLNEPGGINNLDLNEDGTVDYIKVTEYGDSRIKGFSLTTEPAPGEIQEIASIEIEKQGDTAEVAVRGNEHIYGHNHYYHYNTSIVDFLLLGYLFNSFHTPYVSPYYYGYYPSYYRPYRPVTVETYRTRTQPYTSRSTARQVSRNPLPSKASGASSVTSPNQGKTASKGIKAPLKNPTQSQKSFQARNPSKQVKSGGFGRSKTSSSKPTVRRSTSRRSGGSFGGK